MPPVIEQEQEPTLEIAHVLFLDIVSYSMLPIDEQTRLLRDLQRIVTASSTYQSACAHQSIVSLPTGDGMALSFFSSPECPVKCALEISRSIRAGSDLKLRMGVHSGPVYRMQDIKGETNVAGSGINMAQRVMDCGDAGHILLSSAVAEVLNQTTGWAKCIAELGEAEVKHGVKVRIFNLCLGEDGNSALPKKMERAGLASAQPASPLAAESYTPPNVATFASGVASTAAAPAPVRSAAASSPSAPVGATLAAAAAPKKITLVYKRGIQPDEELLNFLEAQLTAAGHSVFIDRHLAIGMEWAKEIERQVRTADALIPLLSSASIHSEMLAYEVQVAFESAQNNAGKPRILPVRVNYEGPLSADLATFLDSLQYAVWHGPADNAKIADELVRGMSEHPRKAIDSKQLESIGGAVPLDSKFYIERATDAAFREAIAHSESIVLLKGARQMGKTSLLARGLQDARKAGARVVLTDLQKLNSSHLESPEAFFLALAELLIDQLDLDIDPAALWNERRGPSANFERILRKEVLTRLNDANLVWGLDEVDRLFTCKFGSEVFGLFRSWHNDRSLDPDGPWKRLTLAIAYATEAHLFITDINQSPFNVGVRLEVLDFTFDQVSELNARYGDPLSLSELPRLFKLVSGHPLLVRRSLHQIASGQSFADYEKTADRDEGMFGDHLRRIIVLLSQDPALCQVVKELLGGARSVSNDSFYRLRTAGLIAGESSKDVHFRCQLYSNYLERHLL